MVGPSMRPPRATSGSSSAAAAAAVAMAMATAAHARFAGLGSSNALQFEDMNDGCLRGNFRRGDERFRQGSKTEGHGSAHFNPLQRRPSAPRMDGGLSASDVHPRPPRRSLRSFSSSPTSLRNLFLSHESARSSSISSTSPPSTSAPFGLPSPHYSRNYPHAQGPLSVSSRSTDPTFENCDYFSHSFSHSSSTTQFATSPIIPGGVDRQYSSSGNFAELSSGATFSPYSFSSFPSVSTQYASRSVDNLLPTGYHERPRRVSPPPISPPLITHIEHPNIHHSAPKQSASHPLLVSSQSSAATAMLAEVHHPHLGRQLPCQWPQGQIFGREQIPTSLESQRSRELAPYGETTTFAHMRKAEELEDEFGLPIDPDHPIVRSNSTPAVFSTFSQACGSTGTRRLNEQLHSPVSEQSGFHQEIPTRTPEMNSPFISSPHQFNTSYPPPPPTSQLSRYPDNHSIGNPTQQQLRRHSEQALSPRRQESIFTSQQSQHLHNWSQHGYASQAMPGSFVRVRGRSAMDNSRSIHQPFKHNFLTGGQQDFHSDYSTHERHLSTGGARSAFDDTTEISSSSSDLLPIAPTPAAREWDIPEEHEEEVFLKQEHELHPFHLDLHHVTERDYHHTTPSAHHQPPLSHALSGHLHGQASSSCLACMSSSSSAQTGTAPFSSSTDVFDASLALVLDDQLHLMDQLSTIHDTLPGAHALDSTSLAHFGGDTSGPSPHSNQVFCCRESGALPPSSSSSVSGASPSAMISSPRAETSSQVFDSSHRAIKIEGHDSTMNDSATHPFQQHPSKIGATPYANISGPRHWQQQQQQHVTPDTEMMYSGTPGQAQRHPYIQHPSSRPSGVVAYHGDLMQCDVDIDRTLHPFDMPSSSGTFGSESQHSFGT
ncbi:hypothetical protein BGZ92_002378, partial [Podila epicladia]